MQASRIFLTSVLFFLCVPLALAQTAQARTVWQSARQVPVVGRVDVVVVGGTTGAVAAAVEAAEEQATVFLIAPRPYLGEDMAATLRPWLDQDDVHGSLTESIFAGRQVTTPMRVKKILEAALLEADVQFLLGCYVTDILFDASGRPAGIVMANRAGRQAIVAKVIVDATERGTAAKLAGAKHSPWPAEKQTCKRVVLGGDPSKKTPFERQTVASTSPTVLAKPTRQIPAGVAIASKIEPNYYEYSLKLDLGDGSFPAIAEAEHRARDQTYRTGQFRAAERFTTLCRDPIHGQKRAADWQQDNPWAIGHFRPANVDRVYVLGPAADVPEKAAEQLSCPGPSETAGRRIGEAAAREAKKIPTPISVVVRAAQPETASHARVLGDIREVLAGLRPTDHDMPSVAQPPSDVRVLAEVDVVVVGGGTSGACAAIGAARQGADVLVVEYQEGLGGVGTVGLIGRPYHGLSRGFTQEVPFCGPGQSADYKMEWFRRQIRRAGGNVWFGVLGCGALVEQNRVRGVVVATPLGRGAILADVVIDATGNADIAVAAGADSRYGDEPKDIAMQGTGLPTRPLGGTYVNTDYLLVDESDLTDTWRALVGTRLEHPANIYDMGTFIQTRERRRVVGDHTLSYLDQIAGRTYPDSIVLSGSDYDSHGYPSEPFFALIPHTKKTLKANHPAPGGTCYTPYRCLLPTGLDGILVTGLAVSMHRDAAAMIRMQKDMHNQGYAAGTAGAMAVRGRCTPRQIDVKALQKHLVEIDNLPDTVLSDRDSFPIAPREVTVAVARLTDPRQSREAVCRALAVVLSHPQVARPAVHEAFTQARGEARLTYAKLLGFLGKSEAVPELIDALERIETWDPKILQGRMAEYAHLPTPTDALILALGHAADRRAIDVLLERLETLDADVTLSHHRALALALERIGDPSAAAPLAALLEKPGMHGHAMTGLEPLSNQDREKRRRTGSLREIVLARALYRCGDHQGRGKAILESYQNDIRGLFARHANQVLAD